MSWTHNICLRCWRRLEGERQPVTANQDLDTCCWCGEMNNDGIYKRADPAQLGCSAKHKEEGT